MTIAAVEQPRDDYVAAGVGPYTGHFQIDSASEVEVLINGVTGVLNVDYTVAGLGAANFSVTLTVAAPGPIVLLRAQPIGQASVYAVGEGFPSVRVSSDYDKVVKIAGMLSERVGRALKFAKKSLSRDIPVDDPSDQKFAYYDLATNTIKWGTLATLGALADPVGITHGGTSSITAAAARTALAVAGLADENLFTARNHWAKGVDIASAAALTPGIDGNYFNVTGVAAITSIASKQAGSILVLRFAGILTFTHNAVSLILPGGGNIITAAGDIAVLVSEGAGNWRCVSYQKASGLAVVVAATTIVMDGTSGLKIRPHDPGQGTWVNGTTTYTAVGSGDYNLFDATLNDGHIVSDPAQFGVVNYIIATKANPTTVTYQYWNGAWTALGTLATPNFNTEGFTQLRFTIPGDWVVGGSGTGVPAGNFNIRVQNTAGAVTVVGRASLANKMDITADEAIVSTAGGVKARHGTVSLLATDIRVASAINGRDQAGAFGANSWIYLWVTSDGVTPHGLWSTSATAPTLQGGDTFKLRIGAFRVDANSVLVPTEQRKNRARYLVNFKDGVAIATAADALPRTLTIPPEAIMARVELCMTAGGYLDVGSRPYTSTGAASSVSTNGEIKFGNSIVDPGAFDMEIEVPQTIYSGHVAAGTGTLDIYTFGYVMPGNLN